MTSENEQFDQELAELRAEFGPENVSIMDKHGIKDLTLIIEDREYEPSEDRSWTVLKEKEYLEALRGIRAWVCVEGHCCWEGDYMLVEGGVIAECPVKMMLDSVEFHKYLGLDTMPNEGKCPYYKEGDKPREEENMEREIRLSLDQIERSLRDTKVIGDGEVITEARIEPGELVVKVVREEGNDEQG